ncbi:MAG: RAMP superfamily CRISPR-associated protein [Candidatus Helarchaeota archaeon]
MDAELKKWNNSINVEVWVNNLRIGGNQQYSRIKLPVFLENNSWICLNLCSSFKGTLRNAIKILLNSIKIQDKYLKINENLFGSNYKSEGKNLAGKLQFDLDYDKILQENKNSDINYIYGIKIDPYFNCVKSKSLYTYEFINDNIKLFFNIKPIFPLTEIEASILLGGLRFLYLRGLGGFNSKGIGIIHKIKIQQDFVEFANKQLKRLLEVN